MRHHLLYYACMDVMSVHYKILLGAKYRYYPLQVNLKQGSQGASLQT